MKNDGTYGEIEDNIDYDDQVLSEEDITNTDIKINPDFYVHRGILKAQDCLMLADTKIGFLQFRIVVEHIESICKASGRAREDYLSKIEDFKKSNDYLDESNITLREIRLANKKLEYLMEEIFSNKVVTSALMA